jgi:hypothetical protein
LRTTRSTRGHVSIARLRASGRRIGRRRSAAFCAGVQVRPVSDSNSPSCGCCMYSCTHAAKRRRNSAIVMNGVDGASCFNQLRVLLAQLARALRSATAGRVAEVHREVAIELL